MSVVAKTAPARCDAGVSTERVIVDADLFDVVMPDPEPTLRAQGHRIRLTRDVHGVASYVNLTGEITLPERVWDVRANHVELLDDIMLDLDQVRWLRDRFNEILGQFATTQPAEATT